MSFILDALKKADEARHPTASSSLGKIRVPRLTPSQCALAVGSGRRRPPRRERRGDRVRGVAEGGQRDRVGARFSTCDRRRVACRERSPARGQPPGAAARAGGCGTACRAATCGSGRVGARGGEHRPRRARQAYRAVACSGRADEAHRTIACPDAPRRARHARGPATHPSDASAGKPVLPGSDPSAAGAPGAVECGIRRAADGGDDAAARRRGLAPSAVRGATEGGADSARRNDAGSGHACWRRRRNLEAQADSARVGGQARGASRLHQRPQVRPGRPHRGQGSSGGDHPGGGRGELPGPSLPAPSLIP